MLRRIPAVLVTSVLVVGSMALGAPTSFAQSAGADALIEEGATVAQAATHRVNIVEPPGGNAQSWGYDPATITVRVGDTVTWTNTGRVAHTATARDGSFDTGLLQNGESKGIVFGRAGTFEYICSPHPWMRGSVVVLQAGAAAPAPPTAPAAQPGRPPVQVPAAAAPAAPVQMPRALPRTGASVEREAGLAALIGSILLLGGAALRRHRTEL